MQEQEKTLKIIAIIRIVAIILGIILYVDETTIHYLKINNASLGAIYGVISGIAMGNEKMLKTMTDIIEPLFTKKEKK